uniref:L-fucose mutarotase n=1 Tax=Oryctolagus cuniculus TaxID=9986 RepID=G1SDC8_RABIT
IRPCAKTRAHSIIPTNGRVRPADKEAALTAGAGAGGVLGAGGAPARLSPPVLDAPPSLPHRPCSDQRHRVSAPGSEGVNPIPDPGPRCSFRPPNPAPGELRGSEVNIRSGLERGGRHSRRTPGGPGCAPALARPGGSRGGALRRLRRQHLGLGPGVAREAWKLWVRGAEDPGPGPSCPSGPAPRSRRPRLPEPPPTSGPATPATASGPATPSPAGRGHGGAQGRPALLSPSCCTPWRGWGTGTRSAAVMELEPSDMERGLQTPVWQDYESILSRAGCTKALAKIERFEFYERARKAFAVVATGETALYGNLILKKGVLALDSLS